MTTELTPLPVATADEFREYATLNNQLEFSIQGTEDTRPINNVLEWNTYLPSNCVATMVSMGWHYTT